MGRDVIDMGRVLINPDFRGLNLFEPLIASALLYADLIGYRYAVGSFRVRRKLINGSYKLGFTDSGSSVYYSEHYYTIIFLKLVVYSDSISISQ